MVDMFDLVLPEKVAEEVVKKDVKLIYDPATNELVQIVMPFMTRSEVTTLTVDKGWVTEASVEDVKLLPGVRRTMFRLQGGEWVAREVVKDVKSGRAKFILNTGDMVWWGKQGRTPSENPYWKLVYEDVLKQLPAPDDQMQHAGLPGRVFPAVGNHEVWEDSDVEGLLECLSLFEEVRGIRQTTHLQVRFQRRSLHLPVDWQIRLSLAHGVGCRPGPRTKHR